MQTRIAPKVVHLWPGEPLLLVALITGAGGTPLTIAQVTSVSVVVFDMTSSTQATEVYSSGSIDPATVFFDTLQTDDYANLLGDSDGYNFRYVLDADSYALLGGRTYQVQITSLVGTSGHKQVYRVVVGSTY